jgi:hypothetical protein
MKTTSWSLASSIVLPQPIIYQSQLTNLTHQLPPKHLRPPRRPLPPRSKSRSPRLTSSRRMGLRQHRRLRRRSRPHKPRRPIRWRFKHRYVFLRLPPRSYRKRFHCAIWGWFCAEYAYLPYLSRVWRDVDEPDGIGCQYFCELCAGCGLV